MKIQVGDRIKSPTGWLTVTKTDRSHVTAVRDDGGLSMAFPRWCVNKWVREVAQEEGGE